MSTVCPEDSAFFFIGFFTSTNWFLMSSQRRSQLPEAITRGASAAAEPIGQKTDCERRTGGRLWIVRCTRVGKFRFHGEAANEPTEGAGLGLLSLVIVLFPPLLQSEREVAVYILTQNCIPLSFSQRRWCTGTFSSFLSFNKFENGLSRCEGGLKVFGSNY